MYVLLETRQEISTAQQSLEKKFKKAFPSLETRDIGYPSGTEYDAKVSTDGHYWFFSRNYSARGKKPRRFNWFGLLSERGALNISVEVNTFHEGRDNSISGFYARDAETGHIYLMHSGRVGGGKKGVSKKAFLAHGLYEFGLPLVPVVDSAGGIREGIIVMPVSSGGGVKSATRYVDAIVDFKLGVRDGAVNTPEFKRRIKKFEDFYSESRGRRKGKRSSEIDYVSRHGEIVDALYDWRVSKRDSSNVRLVKNVLIDMGVMQRRKLIEVFEVKTCCDRSVIYTAIGQLMAHGIDDHCLKTMVLPMKDSLPQGMKDVLERLGIALLRFNLDANRATIVDPLQQP